MTNIAKDIFIIAKEDIHEKLTSSLKSYKKKSTSWSGAFWIIIT